MISILVFSAFSAWVMRCSWWQIPRCQWFWRHFPWYKGGRLRRKTQITMKQWSELSNSCSPAVFVKTMVCCGCSFLQAQKNWFCSLLFNGFLRKHDKCVKQCGKRITRQRRRTWKSITNQEQVKEKGKSQEKRHCERSQIRRKRWDSLG